MSQFTSVPAILSFLIIIFCFYMGATKPDSLATASLATAINVLNIWSKPPEQKDEN